MVKKKENTVNENSDDNKKVKKTNKKMNKTDKKEEKEMKKNEKKGNAVKKVKEVCKKLYVTFRDNDGVMSLVGLATLIVYMILGGDDGGAAMATVAVVTGTAGGKHVMNGPLTTAVTETESPDLLLSEIDRRIVKVRPMSTPLDQI